MQYTLITFHFLNDLKHGHIYVNFPDKRLNSLFQTFFIII